MCSSAEARHGPTKWPRFDKARLSRYDHIKAFPSEIMNTSLHPPRTSINDDVDSEGFFGSGIDGSRTAGLVDALLAKILELLEGDEPDL
jgi:hypothetical protein